MISHVSVCPQTLMHIFRNRVLANLISSYMRSLGVGLFTTRTVGELLWGYEDGLLKTVKLLQPGLDDVFGLFYKVSFKLMCCSYLFLTSAASLGLTFHPWRVSLTEQRFQRRPVRLLHRGTKLQGLCQSGHVER